jgi:Anti-sigma-K factor rskA
VSTPDDERISYLSGERVDALTPQERAELDEFRTLLESPATWEEPDAALEDLVVNAIAMEARRAPAADPAPTSAPAPAKTRAPAETPAPATAPQPAKAPEPKKASIWSRWRPRRPALALGGLATAAAAIAVAVVIAVSGNSTQPLQFAMVVSGTSLAPSAHGNATLTKTESGWRIELSATGLPHLANGRYYQAWLKNAAGILVPVGTFNDAKQVTLWSGAPVTQFRAFSVTEQLANGNPASSGRRVLVGVAHPVH